MTLGVYQPGASAIHRLSPGLKLAALAVYAVAVSTANRSVLLVGLGLLVLIAWQIAGLTWQRLAQNLKPLLWLLLAVFVFKTLSGDVGAAFSTILTLVALVIAAALVSHTTRTDDMLDALTAALCPLARIGLKPSTAAFALVFTVRLVPFVSAVGLEAINARLARGAGRNPIPAVVPVILRLMRETDVLAEALVARGLAQT